MTEAKIRSVSDQDLQYRSQEVRLRDKTIRTPIKAIDYSKIARSASLDTRADHVCEIHHGITKERLFRHVNGMDNSLTYDISADAKKSKNQRNSMQLCFLKYIGDGFPDQNEIEYLTDQAYNTSDMTPIPPVSDFLIKTTDIMNGGKQYGLQNDDKLKIAKKYISDAIDVINQLNNKPIMGYVPNYRPYLKPLVELYVEKGINTFYFDANGSNPITIQSTLRAFMRELNQHGILEKSFVHILNVTGGRGLKDGMIIPAKNILGFGLGIDSLGENHIPPRLPREVFIKMSQNPDNRAKIFVKNNYGYYKFKTKKMLREMYPDDSSVNVHEFLIPGKPDSKIVNAFNTEQLIFESSNIQKIIKNSEPVSEYLNTKKDIPPNDIKILKRAKIKDKK